MVPGSDIKEFNGSSSFRSLKLEFVILFKGEFDIIESLL